MFTSRADNQDWICVDLCTLLEFKYFKRRKYKQQLDIMQYFFISGIQVYMFRVINLLLQDSDFYCVSS